jgi:hypothetical protein
VNGSIVRHIKRDCRKRYGSAKHWPWLALYTELRGEYHEAWIPEDIIRFRWLPEWNRFTEASLNKTFDHQLFGDFAIRPLLRVINGTCYDSEGFVLEPGNIRAYLVEHETEVVVKSDEGRGGTGIFFLKTDQFSTEMLKKYNNSVIQPVIKQHELQQSLSASSVNTMRIVTFLEQDGKVHTVFVNQKIGVGQSRVDNLGGGGLFLNLNEEGVSVTDALGDYGRVKFPVHTDLGIPFKGLKIPGYKKATEACKKAHLKFPYTRLIGWDVAITEKENPVLVEWNARRPGIWADEALFGPFWNLEGNLIKKT